MSITNLQNKIQNRSAKIAQIGLGYVGLPVACMFAKVGFETIGVDVDQKRIATVNAGENPIEGIEPGLAELIAEVVAGGKLRCTTDYSELSDTDIIIIAVQTPVEDDTHQPRYQHMQSALHSLGLALKDGALVVVESTIAPGTMHNVIIPALEASSGKKAGTGFYVGHCPERVMPGRLLHNIQNMDRVIGGFDPDTAATMKILYENIVNGTLDTTDLLTAELVKTTENAYRDVQIAFANEVARVCEALGGDVWKVRELVNKSPGRNMLYPGAGVGGHCIPKDPWLLISRIRDEVVPQLIPMARQVNRSMPQHVLQLTQDALSEAGVDPAKAIVAVLGYAYLENSDDTRDTPSQFYLQAAEPIFGEIRVHDPFVAPYQADLDTILEGVDVAVILVAHDEYRQMDWDAALETMRTPALVDARNVLKKVPSRNAHIRILGKGH